MKIARLKDLNDPFELLAADLQERVIRESIKMTKKDLHKNHGLLCFSQDWKNPVLWSHYGDKHRGICLGFDLTDALAKRVKYSSKRISIPNSGLDETFVSSALLFTKYAHWKYEDEIRVYLKLDKDTVENGHYFYPFSKDLVLREVILGPHCEMPPDSVRPLLSQMYGKSVKIIKSRLAFKSFRVVKDKRYM